MANQFKIKNGLVVSGSADIENNLTVRGTITADEYHITLVSSSVLYESGSTKFGDSLDDSHEFTGSLNITGSILLNGTTVGTGKLDETTFNSFTASYVADSGSFESRIGDLESFSSSLDTSFVSETEFGNYSGSINTFTSSIDGRVDSLETESGSIRSTFNSFTSSYTNVSTSLDSRLDSLETLSGSFTGSFSGSFNGDGTNLFNIPASGVTGLNLTQIADGSVTASVSNTNGLRVNSKTEITGSLIVTDGITGSVDYSNIINKPTLVSGSSQISITGTTGYSTFSSSIDSSIGGLSSSVATTTSNLSSSIGTISSSLNSSIGSLSSSVAITTDNIEDRVGNLEVSTGSLNSFTSSISTTIKNKLNTEGVVSGSSQVVISDTTGFSEFSSSISASVTTIFVDNFGQDERLDLLETSSGSLNSFTSSINTTIKTKLDTEGVVSGSSQIILSGTTGFSVVSASLSSLSSSISITNFNQDGRLNSIETTTGSLNSFTSSINTTIKDKLNVENVVSGSSQIEITGTTGYSTFSSSLATTDLNQENRLNTIEGITGSYATTGSNSFNGNQNITGSLTISQNLTVLGSSSIIYSTASQLIVEDNVIVVNASYPAERFSGLEVHDSGSNGSVTASLLWDGLHNRWIYQNSSDSHYGGAMFIAGPRNTGSIGDEPLLTNGRLPKSIGGDHIGDSIVSELSGSIGISGSLVITGSILSTVTPLVSGSSQISFNGITDKPTLVSGSSQITFSGLTGIPSGLVSGSSQVLSGTGIWSGSSQLPAGVVSGSSQVLFGSISGVPSGLVSGSSQVLNGSGIWSGSVQLPSGVVSGSSQVLNGTTIHSGSFFNNITVVSGSSQISFNGITDKPTLVSGSSQISFGGLTGVPSGLVSGSSQVLLSSGIWSGSAQLPSGVVSGSSQVLAGTTIHSGSFFNGISVVSGSAQISFGGITGVPSGLVSGSSQITGISNLQLTNSSFFVGTTSISLGRTSASQTLTGVSIDGNSANVTGTVTIANGGTGATTAAAARTNLGATTVGGNLFTLTNPSAITFPRFNADNTISSLSAADFRTAIGAGTSSTTGTVTSVGGTGTVSGLSLSGTVTTTGNLTLGGTLTLTSGQITTGLGYTPYNSTNPNGYITGISFANVSSKPTTLSGYGITDALPLTGGTLTSSGRTLKVVSTNDAVPISIQANASAVSTIGFNGTSSVNDFNVRIGCDATSFIIYTNNTERTRVTNGGTLLHGHTAVPGESAWLGTASFGRDGYNKVIMGSLNSTTTGAYVAGHNSAMNAWADLNVAGLNLIFRFQETERARFDTSGHFIPGANNTYNLGSASLGWANIFTNDLHLSNMNKPEGNDIDGTSGTWTIQEGAENLYIINNRNGKKFKISLEEIL
jgi:hypothetical protein